MKEFVVKGRKIIVREKEYIRTEKKVLGNFFYHPATISQARKLEEEEGLRKTSFMESEFY